MSVYFAALNSGSNGNCFYISDNENAILIDAGLSCKETQNRMTGLGLSMNKIKAIFITHEHVDHIKGAEVLSKKYEIPVYLNKATLEGSRFQVPSNHIRFIDAYDEVAIGSMLIKSFSKHHDAADPISFTIDCGSKRIGVFTDIGHACTNIIHHFSLCDIVFLEANYDEKMLESGSYPRHLKNRIQSDRGHLSNAQALELFRTHRSNNLSHLFLAHLSKENNHPDLVKNLFLPHAENTSILISTRYASTALHCVTDDGEKKSCTVYTGAA